MLLALVLDLKQLMKPNLEKINARKNASVLTFFLNNSTLQMSLKWKAVIEKRPKSPIEKRMRNMKLCSSVLSGKTDI